MGSTGTVAHQDVHLSADGKLLAVHVPMQFRKRGGRKVVVAPSGTADTREQGSLNQVRTAQTSGVDAGLVRALAQAHRWQDLLDRGHHATLGDLAKAEKLDKSFVARTLRLTLLAPTIIEAILDGRQLETHKRQALLRGFPIAWQEQELAFAPA